MKKAAAYRSLPVGAILYSIVCAWLPDARAQTLEMLHAFNGADGSGPSGGLVQASDGNFYGTTWIGGTKASGTVFRITANGDFATLVSFSKTNGIEPVGAPVQAGDESLYGVTEHGGNLSLDAGSGYGTVYKLATNGVLTTLFAFSNDTNGASPHAGLIKGADGNLYGTTMGVQSGGSDFGTVFNMTPDGILTTLARFDKTNGAYPQAALVQASDGAFYGTTEQGGDYNLGTIFKVTTNGMLTSLLSFDGTDGAFPSGSLAQGTDGNFYGDSGGNINEGPGSVFQMTPAGVLTTLAWFEGSNGANPWAGLIQAKDGKLYGTTHSGGDYSDGNVPDGFGTVFQVTTDGTLTPLVSFNVTNGMFPEAKLVQGSDGNLYGTTYEGGNLALTNRPYGYGTVFRILMPPSTLPAVNIVVSGNTALFTWPASAGTVVLETADAVPAATWASVAITPVQIGDQMAVTVNMDSPSKFFRLHQP